MSTSRDTILSSIRHNRPAQCELPKLEHAWTTYVDRRAQFIQVLEGVGGQAIVASDQNDLREQLQRLPHFSGARKIASNVPGIGSANIELTTIDSPHALDDVDVAILPGQFAVAENAAVWATDRNVPLRVVYFLCQHLILVVPADQIVDHMHAAYELLGVSREGPPVFAAPEFGVFISGPSKTADIEQSLVIGAHGPRSLTVCLVEESGVQ